uniref:Uncharacterized protein n=1 Tax=Salix viminalis TaxID=40686 RepID=A0A6N2K0F2_SALVM
MSSFQLFSWTKCLNRNFKQCLGSEGLYTICSSTLVMHVPKDRDELAALQARLRKRFPVDAYNKARKNTDPTGSSRTTAGWKNCSIFGNKLKGILRLLFSHMNILLIDDESSFTNGKMKFRNKDYKFNQTKEPTLSEDRSVEMMKNTKRNEIG